MHDERHNTAGTRDEQQQAGTLVLTVATLNIRNRADRWRERAPLLIDQLVELRPDIIGLQEVRRPLGQGAWIRREVNRRLPPGAPPYRLVTAWKTGFRRFWEGLAIMTHLPILETARLDLGGGSRVAQRVVVRLANDQALAFHNTHLHHPGDDDLWRLPQARRITEWMDSAGDEPRILVGDFNATPNSSVVNLFTDQFGSAYRVIHGDEPEATAPTPLNRDDESTQSTIDYIFVDTRLTVHDAWLTFTTPADDDDRLYPSDHYGLAARVAIDT